jgi:5-methylcytosine-specific restriction enzyme subunit McrC
MQAQGGGLFCLQDGEEGRYLFQSRPDIILHDAAGHITLIIDTKWKRISPYLEDKKQGISQADAYRFSSAVVGCFGWWTSTSQPIT